jgi:hypothetical protein
MSTDAIVTMVIGMVAIWGGLAASVVYAVRSHRANVAAAATSTAGEPATGDPSTGDPTAGDAGTGDARRGDRPRGSRARRSDDPSAGGTSDPEDRT